MNNAVRNLFAGVLLAAGLVSGAIAQQPITLKFHTFMAPQSECPQTMMRGTFNSSNAYSMLADTPTEADSSATSVHPCSPMPPRRPTSGWTRPNEEYRHFVPAPEARMAASGPPR